MSLRSVCLVLLLLPVCSVQAENNVSGSFELQVTQGDRTDFSSGMLYYDQSKWLRVRVSSPLEQWMFFERDTLLIYYPGDNSGLKIPSIIGDVSLPVFLLAVNASSEDAGLGDAGYELFNTVVSGDSIVSVWTPPTAAKSVLGNLTTVHIRDSLMSIVGTNRDGDTVLQQTYSTWISYKGRLFPCSVTTTSRDKDYRTAESIVFKDVVLGTTLSGEADSLSVPPDAHITTIEW